MTLPNIDKQWQIRLLSFMKLQKTIKVQYTIIKALIEAFNEAPKVIQTKIYYNLYCQLSLNIRKLTCFQILSLQLWNYQYTPLHLREKTRIFSIVSDWILSYELNISKKNSIAYKLNWLKIFLLERVKTQLEKIVIFNETEQDLKDLLTQQFWNQKNILFTQNQKAIKDRQKQIYPKNEEIIEIIEFIEQIAIENNSIVIQKQKILRKCTYQGIQSKNFNNMIGNCVSYILNIPELSLSTQTQISRVCLRWLRNLNQPKQVIEFIKSLMVRTSRAIRYSLILNYMDFYQFLEQTNNLEMLQQVQKIQYFRQLIIGRSQLQNRLNFEQIENPISFMQHLQIKPGTKEAIYFSNEECDDCILSFRLVIDVGDISLRLIHWFGTKQTVYWMQPKTSSKILIIKLKYQGLYSMQFDNSYSWIKNKNIQYRLEYYQVG